MRVIFSRKGFDSASGGVPSPLVDGCPRSLPIPSGRPTPTRYQDVSRDMGACVRDLTQGRISPRHPCHLDPDIDVAALQRRVGWRGAFGQVGAAQSHLSNHSVGSGDLFLFWGLFRPVARSASGEWHYQGVREHRIFGWLQIDEVVTVGNDPTSALARYPWLAAHPHVSGRWHASNTIYVARERLDVSARLRGTAGFGVFKRGLRLTAPGSDRPSLWAIPEWVNPTLGGTGLTYHPRQRWAANGTLRAAARGQEFIADADHRPDAMGWLTRLFAEDA